MKKITFLLAAVFAVMFVNAQTNLVVNGSFEEGFAGWTKGFTASYTEPTIETSGAQDGSKYAIYANPTATTGFYQNIAVTAGKKYTISFWYKSSGDETDTRIWSSFRDAENKTTIYLAGDAQTNIDTDPLRNNNAYLATASTWTKHEVEFTVPAGAATLQLAVRSYKGATSSFDNFVLVESTSANVEYTKVDKFGFFKSGKHLLSFQISNGTPVEIFNMVGEKVVSTQYNGGIAVGHLNKGVYIVRTDKGTQKVTL